MKEAASSVEAFGKNIAAESAAMAKHFEITRAEFVNIGQALVSASAGNGDHLAGLVKGGLDKASADIEAFAINGAEMLAARAGPWGMAIATGIEVFKPQLHSLFVALEENAAKLASMTLVDGGVFDQATLSLASLADVVQSNVQPILNGLQADWDAVVAAWQAGVSIFDGLGKALTTDLTAPFTAGKQGLLDHQQLVQAWGEVVVNRATAAKAALANGLDAAQGKSGPVALADDSAKPFNNDPLEQQTKSLEKLTNAQLSQVQALGTSAEMSKAYLAVGNAISELYAKNRVLTHEEATALGEVERKLFDVTKATEQTKSLFAIAEVGAAQVAALKNQAAELGLTGAALETHKFQWAELSKIQQAHIPVTDEIKRAIADQASAVGEASAAMQEAKARMAELQAVGTTVANGLDNAFGKFVDSGKFNMGEMVNSMLKDLAKLEFRQAMTGLFGGGSGGGGGLIGSLIGGFLSGARADGGPVDGGKAYLVGERGPELFVPGSSGGIMPSGSFGGGHGGGASGSAPSAVHINIDARGATPDAVQALRSQLATDLPGVIRRELHNVFDRDQRFARIGA